jgi:hypothetical protein
MRSNDSPSMRAACTTALLGIIVAFREGWNAGDDASVFEACSNVGSMNSPSKPASAVSVTMMWGGDKISAFGCAVVSAVEYLLMMDTVGAGHWLSSKTERAMLHMGAETESERVNERARVHAQHQPDLRKHTQPLPRLSMHRG